jgi:hypothetical protein
MGYYAELRAAASLLASGGIALLNNGHVVYEASGAPRVLEGSTKPVPPSTKGRRLNTHVFAWEALDFWASQRVASDLFSSSIESGGRSLGDWMDDFGVPLSSRGVAASWLSEWGLDLQRLSQDRDSRNEVSYRPTGLLGLQAPRPNEIGDFLETIWGALEPGTGAFDVLDRFLIRRRLESGFREIEGRSRLQARRRYEQRVVNAIGRLSLSGMNRAEWANFMTRSTAPSDPKLLTSASLADPVGSSSHHVQVLCRAVLLLRMATAAGRGYLIASKGTRAELSFWWNDVGENCGLWNSGASPADFGDLWADVEAALSDVRSWLASTSPVKEMRGWRVGNAESLDVLATTERAGLWGLLD